MDYEFRLYSTSSQPRALRDRLKSLDGGLCFYSRFGREASDKYSHCDDLDRTDLADLLEILREYPDVLFILVHIGRDQMEVKAYELMNGRILSSKQIGSFDDFCSEILWLSGNREGEKGYESIHCEMCHKLTEIVIQAYLPKNSVRIEVSPPVSVVVNSLGESVDPGSLYIRDRNHREDRGFWYETPTIALYYEIEPGEESEAEAVVQDEVDAILGRPDTRECVATCVNYRTAPGSLLSDQNFLRLLDKRIRSICFLNREYAEDDAISEFLERRGIYVRDISEPVETAPASVFPSTVPVSGWNLPFGHAPIVGRHRLDTAHPWGVNPPTIGIYFEIVSGMDENAAKALVQDEVDAILQRPNTGEGTWTHIVYRTSSSDVLASPGFQQLIEKKITTVRFLNREYAEDADLHERLARKGIRVI